MNLPALLSTAPDLVTLRGLALLLTPELVATLTVVQEAMPPHVFTVAPMPLIDGRFMLCADLLSEIGPGGLYAEGFEALPPEALPLVEVVPMVDAVALRIQVHGQAGPGDDLGQTAN